MYKLVALLLVLFIAGCEDDERAEERLKNRSKQVQELAKDLYVLPPEPKPAEPIPLPVVKEPPVMTPVEFPGPEPLMREERARFLRGKRFDAARRKRIIPALKESATYRIEDPDYRQWERPLPEDKSTYPVDRSRILTADMRIGAVLEDNLNSQIGGRVIAIVDRDVLSPNGRYVLIPAYTKIVCGYEGLDQAGETRLSVSCSRAIRPDGASILLSSAISSDQMGRTGLIGDVDNRTFERYGGAFIVSAISALAQAGVNQQQNQGVQNATTTLSNNLGQVTAEVIKQNIDLRPIITIAAGSRIQIIPQTDIVLRKPLKEQP